MPLSGNASPHGDISGASEGRIVSSKSGSETSRVSRVKLRCNCLVSSSAAEASAKSTDPLYLKTFLS